MESVQVWGARDAVRTEECLSSVTKAIPRARLFTSSRGAQSAALERQTHLTTAQVGPTGAASGSAAHEADFIGHPRKHVASQPTDSSAVKRTLLRKTTEHHHAEQHPSGPAGEARDVVRTQELIPTGKQLVDPGRKRNALGDWRAAARVRRTCVRGHKRPVTCGSGRLGAHCHVERHHAPEGQEISRGRFGGNPLNLLPRPALAEHLAKEHKGNDTDRPPICLAAVPCGRMSPQHSEQFLRRFFVKESVTSPYWSSDSQRQA